jgi:hypothetical protein
MAANPKAVAFLLGSKKPADEEEAPKDDAGAGEGEIAAAGEVRAAIESGSDEQLAGALKSFIEICGTSKSYPEE